MRIIHTMRTCKQINTQSTQKKLKNKIKKNNEIKLIEKFYWKDTDFVVVACFSLTGLGEKNAGVKMISALKPFQVSFLSASVSQKHKSASPWKTLRNCRVRFAVTITHSNKNFFEPWSACSRDLCNLSRLLNFKGKLKTVYKLVMDTLVCNLELRQISI